jgi:hypothetical protein
MDNKVDALTGKYPKGGHLHREVHPILIRAGALARPVYDGLKSLADRITLVPMPKIVSVILWIAIAAFGTTSDAGDGSDVRQWITVTTIYSTGRLTEFRRLELSYNSPEDIQKELLGTNLVRLAAAGLGASEEVWTNSVVRQRGDTILLDCFCSPKTSPHNSPFAELGVRLRKYVELREVGFTREFAMTSLSNRTDLSAVEDPDLRAFLQKAWWLPADHVKKVDSGTQTLRKGRIVGHEITNADGTISYTNVTEIPPSTDLQHWGRFSVVDGEVAATYFFLYGPENSDASLSTTFHDAREDDPRTSQIIEAAQAQAKAQLRKQGVTGLGFIRSQWTLMKEILRARGIDWHSPADLNPNIKFD